MLWASLTDHGPHPAPFFARVHADACSAAFVVHLPYHVVHRSSLTPRRPCVRLLQSASDVTTPRPPRPLLRVPRRSQLPRRRRADVPRYWPAPARHPPPSNCRRRHWSRRRTRDPAHVLRSGRRPSTAPSTATSSLVAQPCRSNNKPITRLTREDAPVILVPLAFETYGHGRAPPPRLPPHAARHDELAGRKARSRWRELVSVALMQNVRAIVAAATKLPFTCAALHALASRPTELPEHVIG